jgi:dTDP-glucose 4,6-dehydratase
MKNKIFVTGSEGFIGSHIVQLLIKKGFFVKALVQYNSFSSWGWLEELNLNEKKRIEVIFGDVRDLGGIKRVTKDCNNIIHLAALISIPYSYHSPRMYLETNITGTLNILEAAKENKIEHLIHASTSEVYGTAQYIPIDEKHPLQGQSPYSATKIAADKLVESYYRSFDLPVTTLRPFNVFGPRQSARAIIPTIISQIMNKSVTLYGFDFFGSKVMGQKDGRTLQVEDVLPKFDEVVEQLGSMDNISDNNQPIKFWFLVK